jgi:hypothetical protein
MKLSDGSFVYLQHLNANGNLRMGSEWNWLNYLVVGVVIGGVETTENKNRRNAGKGK